MRAGGRKPASANCGVAINGITVAGGGTGRVDNFTVGSIPEPSAVLLDGLGLLALVCRRR